MGVLKDFSLRKCILGWTQAICL